jgi:CheY-like chemotaxis protein
MPSEEPDMLCLLRVPLSRCSEPVGFHERTARVLLVEDDREFRQALGDLLRLEGYEVAEAENGLDALLHLRTSTPAPDLLVMDLDMPLMSGWELLEEQRRDQLVARIPVVVLSSSPDLRGLDVEGTLPKPCHPDLILEVVRRALRSARGRYELPE